MLNQIRTALLYRCTICMPGIVSQLLARLCGGYLLDAAGFDLLRPRACKHRNLTLKAALRRG